MPSASPPSPPADSQEGSLDTGSRKEKFSDDELQAMVDGITRHYQMIHGNKVGKTSSREKAQLWAEIEKDVNAHANTHRMVVNIQKRWQDLKGRVKHLVAKHQRAIKATGGAAPPPYASDPGRGRSRRSCTTGLGGVQVGTKEKPGSSKRPREEEGGLDAVGATGDEDDAGTPTPVPAPAPRPEVPPSPSQVEEEPETEPLEPQDEGGISVDTQDQEEEQTFTLHLRSLLPLPEEEKGPEDVIPQDHEPEPPHTIIPVLMPEAPLTPAKLPTPPVPEETPIRESLQAFQQGQSALVEQGKEVLRAVESVASSVIEVSSSLDNAVSSIENTDEIRKAYYRKSLKEMSTSNTKSDEHHKEHMEALSTLAQEMREGRRGMSALSTKVGKMSSSVNRLCIMLGSINTNLTASVEEQAAAKRAILTILEGHTKALTEIAHLAARKQTPPPTTPSAVSSASASMQSSLGSMRAKRGRGCRRTRTPESDLPGMPGGKKRA